MISSILLGIGWIIGSYFIIKGTIEINKAHERRFKELGEKQPIKEEEFIFIDELEDLSPEHTLLATDEEEKTETLFYL